MSNNIYIYIHTMILQYIHSVTDITYIANTNDDTIVI